LVLDQESQILPIFVVRFEPIQPEQSNLEKKFLRKIRTQSANTATKISGSEEQINFEGRIVPDPSGSETENEYLRW